MAMMDGDLPQTLSTKDVEAGSHRHGCRVYHGPARPRQSAMEWSCRPAGLPASQADWKQKAQKRGYLGARSTLPFTVK